MTTENLEDRAITENDDPDDVAAEEPEVGEPEAEELEAEELEAEEPEAGEPEVEEPEAGEPEVEEPEAGEPEVEEPEAGEPEAEEPEAGEPEVEEGRLAARHETGAAPDRRLHLVLVGGAVLLLVASVFTWWRASNHDASMVEQAKVRDAVLITATGAIETLNSLDYRDVDGGLESWGKVTTGTLHDQLVNETPYYKEFLVDQQAITVAEVVDAAVVDLTDDTATVIASIEQTVRIDTGADAEPTVKRNRFAADLVKVGDEWLVETLDQVAVNVS
jgi:Mce-associated membrane protein